MGQIYRHYESALPIRNDELYDMVRKLTIEELSKFNLTYEGECYHSGSIILGSHRWISPIKILVRSRGSVGLNPFVISGNSENTTEKSFERAESRLSGLLKMEIRRVPTAAVQPVQEILTTEGY